MKELEKMTLEELRAKEREAWYRSYESERTAKEAYTRWQEVWGEIRSRTESLSWKVVAR